MRFSERKEFLTDPEIFGRGDTETALKIYAEAVSKHSAKPRPRFFEVDRDESQYDELWHAPVESRIKYRRQLDIPAINKFIKPDWRLTKIGIVAQRRDDFILSFNALKEFDYFPMRGDRVYWNGYRYMVIKVVIDPEAYWHQTNQWVGLRLECLVPPEGDARPIANLGTTAIPELPNTAAIPSARI